CSYVTFCYDSCYLSASTHLASSLSFTVPPATQIFTLSLHDALPISMPDEIRRLAREILRDPVNVEVAPRRSAPAAGVRQTLFPVASGRKRDLLAHLLETEARSEEHTSELQSRGHLVCRLLLEKKKQKNNKTT